MNELVKTIGNFILFVLQLFKMDVKVSIAKTILSSGVLLAVGGPTYNIFVEIDDIKANIQVDNTGYVLLVLGIVLILISVVMLIRFYTSITEHSYLYFSPSLKGMSTEIPIYAVDKKDKYTVRAQNIGQIDSYNKASVIEEYTYLKKSFEKRFDHFESTKVYMAVIGSFPYMYLLGTLLRNGHIKSIIMDYSNAKQEWFTLQNYGPEAHHELLNSNSSIDDEINRLANNSSHDVGIALSYTYEIYSNAIPQTLQDNTLYLKNSLGIGHYLLNSEETQQSLINELLQLIQKLSKNNKKIHLFVSAQTSFCVNLGKRYQDNVTGNIILHNYDAHSKSYNWEIEVENLIK